MNRKVTLTIALLLIAALSAAVLRYVFARLSKEKREAHYRAELTLFTESLKPGMARKQVEDYLRFNNKSFIQISGIADYKKKSWDDLVLIGNEEAPWFCSGNYVYIAFEFTDYPNPRRKLLGANEQDRLNSISIFHQLGGCL